MYIEQYIIGLPAEIRRSHRRILGSPGLQALVYFEPCHQSPDIKEHNRLPNNAKVSCWAEATHDAMDGEAS